MASTAALVTEAPASRAMASPAVPPAPKPAQAQVPAPIANTVPPVAEMPAPASPVQATSAPSEPASTHQPHKVVAEEAPPPWMDEVPPWMDEAPLDAEVASMSRPAASGGLEEPPIWDEPDAAAAPDPEPAASNIVIPVVKHTALGERWAAVVAQMTSAGLIAALARELALQAELVGVETVGAEEVWRLKVERESLRTAPLQDKLQAALRTTLSAAEGAPLARLELVAGVAEDSPARREAERQALRQQAADVAIRTDPLVSGVLAQFSTARIVSGSIRPLH